MKYQLEIFVEGQRLDVFDYESVTIKQSVKDLKKIDKIFTPFSQSFTVPASKSNNKVLKHYYNSSIVGGFDARKYASAELKINGEYFEDGNVALESVKMRDGSAESYTLRFYGRLTELSKQIGEDYLHQLDFTSYDIPSSSLDIGNRLTDPLSVSGGIDIAFFLSSRNNRFIYHSGQSNYAETEGWENVKNIAYVNSTRANAYAVVDDDVYGSIRVKAILEQIESKYPVKFNGLSDSISGLSDKDYIRDYRLVLNKASRTKEDEVIVTSVDTIPNTTESNSSGLVYEVDDNQNIKVTSLGSSQVTVETNGEPVYYLGSGLRIKQRYQLRYRVTSNASNYKLRALVNGETIRESGKEGESASLDSDPDTFVAGGANSTWKRYGTRGTDQRIDLWHNYGAEPVVNFEIETNETANFTIEYRVVQLKKYHFSEAYTTHTITKSTSSTGGDGYNVGKNMPKIKVKDFITTLFKQFNIIATVKKDDTYGNLIECKHYDYFINSGNEFDITEYTDISDSTIKPTTNYNAIEFKLNKPKSAMEVAFDRVNNRQYGALNYELNEGEDNVKGVPFEFKLKTHKVPYERLDDLSDGSLSGIQYAQFTDLDSQNVDMGVTFTYLAESVGDSISYDNGTSVQQVYNPIVPVSYYSIYEKIYPGNSSSEVKLNQSVLVGDFFGEETDEYFRDSRASNLGHINLFWQSYLNLIFDSRNRKVTVKSYLPQRIIRTLNPADKIIIGDKKHIIESFSTNFSTGLTRFELIQVSDFVYNQFKTSDISVLGVDDDSVTYRSIVFMDENGVMRQNESGSLQTLPTVIGEIKSDNEYPLS